MREMQSDRHNKRGVREKKVNTQKWKWMEEEMRNYCEAVSNGFGERQSVYESKLS